VEALLNPESCDGVVTQCHLYQIIGIGLIRRDLPWVNQQAILP